MTTTQPLNRNQRRALVALRRGPLYRGAIAYALGGKVVAPGRQLRELESMGLARCTRTAWELTEAGEEALR